MLLRRDIFKALIGLAAPAIIRPGLLMPIKAVEVIPYYKKYVWQITTPVGFDHFIDEFLKPNPSLAWPTSLYHERVTDAQKKLASRIDWSSYPRNYTTWTIDAN